jgi:hypothetical protein
MNADIKSSWIKNLLQTLAVGIFFAILGHCVAGCDGMGVEVSDAGVLSRTDAGTIHCTIPSPAGDQLMVKANGQVASPAITMSAYYERAAQNGNPGYWGVLTNSSDLPRVCADPNSTKTAACGDFTKTCIYATCDTSTGTQLCHADAIGGWASSNDVEGALCSPDGKFAGWLCKLCRPNAQGVVVCVQG